MTKDEINSVAIPHLRGQFELASPVLFTGAGFSLTAKNQRGEPIPSYGQLREALWSLCFPGEPFEPESNLQDLYDTALRQHPKDLTALLLGQLTVDSDSLPTWYETIFSMPWALSYTLNVDDLALAVSRRFNLSRRVAPVSAPTAAVVELAPDALSVIHLNGTLKDVPGGVTFSLTQYAERLSRPDFWYSRLTANLVSHSIVFIGTRLDEPPLWQHLELRRTRRRGSRELRPGNARLAVEI